MRKAHFSYPTKRSLCKELPKADNEEICACLCMQLNQHRWLTLWSRVIWSKEPPLNEAKYQCKLKQEKKHDMLVPDLLLTPLRTRSDSLCTQLTRPSSRHPVGTGWALAQHTLQPTRACQHQLGEGLLQAGFHLSSRHKINLNQSLTCISFQHRINLTTAHSNTTYCRVSGTLPGSPASLTCCSWTRNDNCVAPQGGNGAAGALGFSVEMKQSPGSPTRFLTQLLLYGEHDPSHRLGASCLLLQEWRQRDWFTITFSTLYSDEKKKEKGKLGEWKGWRSFE